jgi:hypothetical protein
MTRLSAWLTATRRRTVYRVANAGLALAVAYQLVDGDKSALWLLLVNAVLGIADANVPKSDAEEPPAA